MVWVDAMLRVTNRKPGGETDAADITNT